MWPSDKKSLEIPTSGYWTNENLFLHLKAAAPELLGLTVNPVYTSDIGSVGTILWPCRRILQRERRQSWRTHLCYTHAYENESTFGYE